MKNVLTKIALSSAIAALLTSPVLAESKTVEFSKGDVISLHFIDETHQARGHFIKEKLPELSPTVEQSGGKVVAKFETIDVEEGDITPQYVVLMAWPDKSKFESAFTKETIAQDGLRAHNIGLFSLAQDTAFKLTDKVVYEWFGGNPSGAETPKQLQTFFQNVIPTAMEYGRSDALMMQPLDSGMSDYKRLIAGMATWPTAASFEQFTNTDVFRSNIQAYRNPAFSNLELINTYWVK